MTTGKDFKRVVRARMRKTGEAYTTARARLLATRPRDSSALDGPATRPKRARRTSDAATPMATTRAPGATAPSDFARVAGMSDAAVKAATGCTWERWVRSLDHQTAHAWTHTEIARHVREHYKVSSWWAQAVTVGYERIRGLRARGQRRGGEFRAQKSRTFAVSVDALYRAFRDARRRARWLPGVALTVRTATPRRSMRITWNDGTDVLVGFAARGAGKSQVQVEHGKLRDATDATRRRAFWTERLEALSKLL